MSDTPNLAGSETYDFLASYQAACERDGWDYAVEFDRWFTHGYVIKTPVSLLMGGDLPPGVGDGRPAWFVWWAEANPRSRLFEAIRLFLRQMPHHRPWVCFCRGVRGRYSLRYYSTDRLMRLTGISP